MANELQHVTVGTELTQAEYESVTGHQFNSQATGDLLYASSASQLSRLGIGSANQVLQVSGGVPAWTGEVASLTLNNAVGKGTWTASGTWTLPAVTLGGAISGNGQDILNAGRLSVAAGGSVASTVQTSSVLIYGGDGTAGKGAIVAVRSVAATAGELSIYTPDAATTSNVQRLYITGSVATAVANWVNVTHTGIVLSGALDANAQSVSNLGASYIGDTANAKVTLGLTINQGANDDEILSLKSSDVGHAATGLTEADTYGAITKAEATSGGLLITGYKDGDGVAGLALQLRGVLDETAADTTKTTAGIGIVTVTAGIEAANTIGDAGANENLMVIQNNATTRFIFDVEGSGHADVEWIAFDAHQDVLLMEALEVEMTGRPRRLTPERFGVNPLAYERARMEALGIVGRDSWHEENGRQRQMVNFTRLAMLHHGAILQEADERLHLVARMDQLEAENARLRDEVASLRR